MSENDKSYAEWSILELLGHRRLAGFVTEHEIAGRGFLRIDIPGPNGSTVTQFYSPDAVYGMTPTTEEIARRAAVRSPAPISPWELTLPAATKDDPFDRAEDYPPDDDEDAA